MTVPTKLRIQLAQHLRCEPEDFMAVTPQGGGFKVVFYNFKKVTVEAADLEDIAKPDDNASTTTEPDDTAKSHKAGQVIDISATVTVWFELY